MADTGLRLRGKFLFGKWNLQWFSAPRTEPLLNRLAISSIKTLMQTISTQNLAALPDVPTLKRLTQSLAMLDAILSPDWEGRYYSFNTHWAEGESMASMRDASGNEWFLLFTPVGAILKGFADEVPMAAKPIWPSILSDVPAAFSGFLSEPAFYMEETTFCFWRTFSDTQWQKGNIVFPPGPDPDGSADLLSILDGKPETYQQWAEEYYDLEVSLAAVAHVYAQFPLTTEIVMELNGEADLTELAADIAEIGYPCSSVKFTSS